MEKMKKTGSILPTCLVEAIHKSTLVPVITKKSDEEILLKFISLIKKVRECDQELASNINDSFSEIIEMISQKYMDTRLLEDGIKVFNKKYAIYIIKNAIHEAIKNSATFQEFIVTLRRYARLEMDMNGLKAINTFASKQSGDEAIKRVVLVLRDSQAIVSFCRDHNLKVLLTSEGGDEFAYWIKKKDGEFNNSILSELSGIIRKEISKIETRDIFDFKDSEVQARLTHKGINFSEDNVFVLSMACGYFSLQKALLYALFEKRFEGFFNDMNRISKTEYIDFLNRVLHHIFNWSEYHVNLQKENDFHDDKISEDPNRVIRAITKQRTGEEAVLIQKNTKLTTELEDFKKELASIRARLDKYEAK